MTSDSFRPAPGSLLSISDLTLEQVSEILALASVLEAEDPVERGAAIVQASRGAALL